MRDIDNLLRHFSNIALAWQARLLSIHDIRPIQHYMLRVVRNPEIKNYIDFVARWSKQQQLGEHPYAVLKALPTAGQPVTGQMIRKPPRKS